MVGVSKKYEFFEESLKARPVLLNFKENYERVKSGLETAWAHLQDAESVRGEIQAQLARASEALRAAAALGAHFARVEAKKPEPTMRCNSCGADAPLDEFRISQQHGNGYVQHSNQYCNGIFHGVIRAAPPAVDAHTRMDAD